MTMIGCEFGLTMDLISVQVAQRSSRQIGKRRWEKIEWISWFQRETLGDINNHEIIHKYHKYQDWHKFQIIPGLDSDIFCLTATQAIQ